jgi:predicted phage terminase large subunit-like protein
MAGKVSAVDAYRAVLQTDYCEYVSHVHHGAWIKTPLHRFLTRYVQNFVERETDKPYEILVISMPPQHGKSQSVTETLPSWYLGRHPDRNIIEISYNEEFAIKFGRANKRKIEEFGESIFGIHVAKDPNRAVEFMIAPDESDPLRGGGGMISRGCLTGVTGQRCNLMIIDDPVKNRSEAFSKSRRDQLYEEWLMSYKSRLAPGAKVIVIMTRWHEDDLAGRIIQTEENVKVLNLPCECEDENEPFAWVDADGNRCHRKVGDALCPEIGKGNAWLAEYKKGLVSTEGSMTWNALFQGRPTAAEGNIIGRDWWKFYEEGELPQINTWVMSVDAAFKDEDQSDFVAIQVWGKTGGNIYLIDAVKKHLSFPDTIMEIRRLRGLYPECKTTLVEDRANGSAIIRMLRYEMTGVIAVQPIGSKMARVQAVLGAIESGNVWLPKSKRFTGDFVEECSSFPNAAHDDQVDAMSQALNRLIYQRGGGKIKTERDYFADMFPMWAKKMNRNTGHGKVRVV